MVAADAGDELPKAEVAGFAPKALVEDVVAGAVVAAGGAEFVAVEASDVVAPSLLALAADPKPNPVEPKADAGLPLPAAPLKAPKPKPLAGLEGAPNAGDGAGALEGDPKAEACPNADVEDPKADLDPKADAWPKADG